MAKPSLSKVTAEITGQDIAERILALHCEAQKSGAACTGWAKLAISQVIEAGELLIQVRENLERGDFLAWLDALIESSSIPFSRATAYNYMRAVRHKSALDQAEPEFATVKELYVHAGILPKPPESAPAPPSERSQPFYHLSVKITSEPPEKWQPMDRREFLEKARPVVELYARVKAVEEES